jgi:hypothetical protein
MKNLVPRKSNIKYKLLMNENNKRTDILNIMSGLICGESVYDSELVAFLIRHGVSIIIGLRFGMKR